MWASLAEGRIQFECQLAEDLNKQVALSNWQASFLLFPSNTQNPACDLVPQDTGKYLYLRMECVSQT